MAFASKISSGGLITLASVCFITLFLLGIAAVVVLSLIPTYVSTRTVTPVGEKYCINNLRLRITPNTTITSGDFNSSRVNTSYPLSESCLRILQNFKSDSHLSACLISNCSVTTSTTVTPLTNVTDILCSAEIYYNSRCDGTSSTSGFNNSLNASSRSLCRTRRIGNINQALGSTSTAQFSNVPSLAINGTIVPIQSIRTFPFSLDSQVGAFFCGLVNQRAISTAVNTQAVG